MRLIALWLLPALAGAVSYALPAHRSHLRAGVLVTAAISHLVLVVTLWAWPANAAFGGWLATDALGLLVLTLTSIIFFLTTLYTVGYLQRERPRGGRVFVAGLLGFLAAATLVALSQHLALLWVGMEATTLALAPLIFHRHDRRSLEAVWKYLVLSSVGIALALLGIFFLATAQTGVPGRPLVVTDLAEHASRLHPAWLRAAFVFMLVGFGTKMGLAPLHNWKPDVYGEAPSLVSGLMSGVLTSCAFLGVARISGVLVEAGLATFAQPVLIAFGLVSLVVAAGFIIGQSDMKRLLAYSSVEHMGILVLGLGLGGLGTWGSVLHMLNNGFAKSWLFLVVGNMVLASGSSAIAANRGLLRTLPVSGTLLVIGLFAVTGSPPFGLFISEFTILRAAFGGGHPWIASAMLILLATIFVGIAAPLLEMVLGDAETQAEPVKESRWLLIAPVALATVVLILGLYIPRPLQEVLARAAAGLGGVSP
jgi:hydrogenase-4 component F